MSQTTASYNLFSVFGSQLLHLKCFPGASDYPVGVGNVVATHSF